MRLWRLTRFPELDGKGGAFTAARWHEQGLHVLYTATQPAGALIEVLCHLDVEPDEIPDGYHLVGMDVPDAVINRALVPKLPVAWADDIDKTRALGSAWLRKDKSLLYRVPSAIIDQTWNYLMNPRHTDLKSISVIYEQEFRFDERLLAIKKPSKRSR